MKRRELLVAAATTPLLTAFACKTAAARPQAERERDGPPRPRNLLVIVSDDQSRFDLGAYGNPACATPHVDRLAEEGLRFQRGYTPVSLCMPARSCMYTGLYPHRNGATGFEPVRAGVKTWPNWLGAACATGMIGKLNVLPTEQFPFEVMKRGGLVGKHGRSPERYERLFAEFLSEVEGRRFAAVVNLKDPHRPFDEDRFVEQIEGAPPSGFDPERVWIPGCLWDTPATRQELADYYAALQRMDETAGRVLRLLDEAGLADDTLVVFTSDNGMPFPFAKSTLYEAGINVPFVARWPGVLEPGGESEALVSLVDLLPTALDAMGLLAGLEPGTFDGHSLLPLLRGEVPAVRERVVGALDELLASDPTPARSIRDARFKYVHNFRPEVSFENNILIHSQTWSSWLHFAETEPALAARVEALTRRPREELYDLEADPFELADLAANEAHRDTLARLRGELRAWTEENGDPIAADWPA